MCKNGIILLGKKEKPHRYRYDFFLVWSMRLELTRVYHTPLKRTRLPFRHDHILHTATYKRRFWCEGRDLNPHCLQHEPESCASAIPPPSQVRPIFYYNSFGKSNVFSYFSRFFLSVTKKFFFAGKIVAFTTKKSYN